jgi:hypothetical protein
MNSGYEMFQFTAPPYFPKSRFYQTKPADPFAWPFFAVEAFPGSQSGNKSYTRMAFSALIRDRTQLEKSRVSFDQCAAYKCSTHQVLPVLIGCIAQKA